MEYRQLGNTGIKFSEIGFGAWANGGDARGPVEDASSRAALERTKARQHIEDVAPMAGPADDYVS